MAGDTDVLWQRVDEHSKRLGDVETQTKMNAQTLGQHAEEFRRMNKEIASNHTAVMHGLDGYSKKVDLVIEDFHKRQGAKEAKQSVSVDFKWAIGTIIAVVAVIVAIYAGTH